MVLQALIFDVDGTLADTEQDGHLVAFNMAFEKAGLDWDWSSELYQDLLAVTGGKERIRYYLEKFNTAFAKPSNFDDFVVQLHKSKTQFYMQLMAEGKIPLRPGVVRLLQEARTAGLRLAIATTTTPANVTALLESTLGAESLQWFEVIAAGDIVSAKKPAPDIFLYALEKLGLKAEQCLAFEDSENGIKSSIGAGLKTIITINDYTKAHDFSAATLVLSDLGEPDCEFEVINNPGHDLSSNAYFDIALAKKLMQ